MDKTIKVQKKYTKKQLFAGSKEFKPNMTRQISRLVCIDVGC